MGPGTRFRRFIPEEDEKVLSNQNVRRLVLCSGKVYYDLLAHREENNITDVAIGRVEQISPFPFDLVHRWDGGCWWCCAREERKKHTFFPSRTCVYLKTNADALRFVLLCLHPGMRMTSRTPRLSGARRSPRTWARGRM